MKYVGLRPACLLKAFTFIKMQAKGYALWQNGYALPRFWRMVLQAITPLDIDNWLLDVKSKRSKKH